MQCIMGRMLCALLLICVGVTVPPSYAADTREPHGEQHAALLAAQSSFRSLAKNVYPAVVSITTVHIQKQRGGIYYIPDNDPFFNDFFGEYFGVRRKTFGFKMPDREFKKVGIGSGVIIDPRGYILTNYHVVEQAYENKVTVRLTDGREYEGIVKGVDPRYDLSLIQIVNEGDVAFPAAIIGDSNKVEVGDWAIAIGNPYGFAFDDAQPTMTVGVVSALNRSLPGWVGMDRSYTNLIQTDAAINVGNSGGPLVNINGEVIGINVAIVSTTGGNQGIGFALPSNLCQDIIAEVIEGKEVLYSWLGISVQNLNQALSEYFKYPSMDGVLIIKVLQDSPAKVAGLRDGDIVMSFNNKPVTKVDALLGAINAAHVGEKATLRVFRDGTDMEVTVIMGSKPRDEEPRDKAKDVLFWRGIKVDNVTYELARDLNVPTLKGVVVNDVQSNSAAEAAGVTVGEVIIEINGATVNNIEDYYNAIQDARGDALVKTLRGFFVVKE